jgi:hypothetical protein
MRGKNPRLTPLQSRKQLLIVESELNRAQLAAQWVTMAEEFHGFTHRAKSYLSLASSAAVLVAGLGALRRRKPTEAGAKPSWLARLLKGAGLASALWQAFGSKRRRE